MLNLKELLIKLKNTWPVFIQLISRIQWKIQAASWERQAKSFQVLSGCSTSQHLHVFIIQEALQTAVFRGHLRDLTVQAARVTLPFPEERGCEVKALGLGSWLGLSHRKPPGRSPKSVTSLEKKKTAASITHPGNSKGFRSSGSETPITQEMPKYFRWFASETGIQIQILEQKFSFKKLWDSESFRGSVSEIENI